MESRSVQGSGANVYELKRVGETYSCSCPSWRNPKGAGSMRTCKHLKALRGEQAELERLGGDPKAFFASGNRVAGQAAAAGAGVAPTNEAVVKTVALADSWDGVRDLTGWALSEKLDGMRCLWDGKGGCFSRAGKEVYVPASLCLQLPLGTALDGELWLGRGQFQRAMSIVRRTDRSESAWAPIEYVVYDAPEAPGGIFDRLAFEFDHAPGRHSAWPLFAPLVLTIPRTSACQWQECKDKHHEHADSRRQGQPDG
jgi:DNA ligase-1